MCFNHQHTVYPDPPICCVLIRDYNFAGMVQRSAIVLLQLNCWAVCEASLEKYRNRAVNVIAACQYILWLAICRSKVAVIRFQTGGGLPIRIKIGQRAAGAMCANVPRRLLDAENASPPALPSTLAFMDHITKIVIIACAEFAKSIGKHAAG